MKLLALLLGRLLVALPDVSSVAVAIVVRRRCPGSAMKDSSSVVERLRIPRGRKSESAVVPVFVLSLILTSLRPRCEASGAPVGLAWAYRDCAHPNFISSGHACARLSKRGLGVSTFPGKRDGRT
ncbi:hypothetical protein CDL15_Pgr028286 [Punica granatum]|uniref:Secreted protein n=1 Tax=Punica granatum TaxID=22663 RepID=A0A218X045_PUNGR|nr:hypothetical protein CDL15_Pgr028286 [Punica granatum]